MSVNELVDPLVQPGIVAAAQAALAALRQAGLPVVTAESCTGGLVAASLTHHAGSSDIVLGGFVTYANEMKQALLGVPHAMLAEFGAVSEPVALAMAEGALRAAPGAGITVAITGIAGPGGGSAEKPVGLVWFAIARGDRPSRAERVVFSGDRSGIRSAAALHALGMLTA